jgi:hypothetical protein
VLVTARSWKFESSSGHQFKSKVTTLDFSKTRESGFLRFCLSEIQATYSKFDCTPVGAAEGCDLLMLLLKQDQKIAAFGSSYRTSNNCSIRPRPAPQGALEKQYRLSLLQDFAMRQ